MPKDVIYKSWIKQDIRSQGINVFIVLVRQERLDVCLAAKQFNKQLGLEGIIEGKIKGKLVLSIKAKLLETTYKVEEIRDSEDESKDKDKKADRRVKIAQLHVCSQSALAASLRQIILPKLFIVVV